jgi:hypothetical protein
LGANRRRVRAGPFDGDPVGGVGVVRIVDEAGNEVPPFPLPSFPPQDTRYNVQVSYTPANTARTTHLQDQAPEVLTLVP